MTPHQNLGMILLVSKCVIFNGFRVSTTDFQKINFLVSNEQYALWLQYDKLGVFFWSLAPALFRVMQTSIIKIYFNWCNVNMQLHRLEWCKIEKAQLVIRDAGPCYCDANCTIASKINITSKLRCLQAQFEATLYFSRRELLLTAVFLTIWYLCG